MLSGPMWVKKVFNGSVVIVLLNLTFLVCAGYFVSRRVDEYRPFHVRLAKISPLEEGRSIFLKDLDGDGQLELVYYYITIGNQKQYVVGAEELFEDRYVPPNYLEIMVPGNFILIDATWDHQTRKIRYWFEAYDEQGLSVHVLSGYNQEDMAYPLEPPSLSSGEILTSFHPKVVDLDSDGKNELLNIWQAGYSQLPRGVVVYDLETGKKAWEYFIGSMPNRWEIADLDNDGRKEIVMGTFASMNGVRVDGTSDIYSYVVVLGPDGSLRWIRRYGFQYTLAYVNAEDIDGDGISEVLATLDTHSAPTPDPGKVCILNGLDGKPQRCIEDPRVAFSDPYIFEKNGQKFVVVGDSSGRIRLMNVDLQELKSINVGEPVRVINQDVTPEDWPYITAFTPTKIIFMDFSLHIIDTVRFNRELPNIRGGQNLLMPVRHQSRCAIIPLVPRYTYFCENEVRLMTWILEAVDTPQVMWIVFWFLGNLAYLLQRIMVEKPLRSTLEKEKRAYQQWISVLQEIVHQMKSPLATLLWTLERIQSIQGHSKSTGGLAEKLASMEEDIYRLRSMIHRLMMMFSLDRLEYTDIQIDSMIRSLAEKYRALIDERIKVDLEVSGNVVIRGNPELLKEVFENLLDNAIESMPDGGILRIFVTPVFGLGRSIPREVIIEVEDTGCGIPEDKIKHVFEPYYSTKQEGMGLGLTIARRIVEAHGGRIEIHSRQGFGTRVVVRFPVEGDFHEKADHSNRR